MVNHLGHGSMAVFYVLTYVLTCSNINMVLCLCYFSSNCSKTMGLLKWLRKKREGGVASTALQETQAQLYKEAHGLHA